MNKLFTAPMRLSFVFLLLLFLVACSDENDTPNSPNVDSGAPQIGFLSISGITPQGNATVTVPRSFTVLLNPTARGGKSITRVELNVNGINLPSKSSPPWEFEVDFGAISTSGPALLSAVAVDSSGMRSAPATQQVIVDGAPPEITISEPTQGQTIEGAIPVTVTATDLGAGIRVITVLFDGEEVRTQNYSQLLETQTFETTIPVTSSGITIPDGQYNIAVQAIDGFGNLGTSSQVTITTNNADTDEPPDTDEPIEEEIPESSAVILRSAISPAPESIPGCTSTQCYRGILTIPVAVRDQEGDALVRLFVEGPFGTQILGPDSEFPFFFEVDSRLYPDNTELTFIAERRDGEDGTPATSAPVSITVFNSDSTPPELDVIRPSNGEERSGNIPVTIETSDEESGIDIIRIFFDGIRVVNQDFDLDQNVTFEATIPVVDEATNSIFPDGAYDILVEVVNGAGLVTQSGNIVVNTANEGSPPSPPTEVAIGEIVEAEEDGAIRVPVRVVVRPGDTVDQVVLTIRSEELGTQQPQVRQGTETPYVFVVDTQEFADGDTLFFIARATTEPSNPDDPDAEGGVANSEEVSYTVSKPGFVDVAPSLSITSPEVDEIVTEPIMPVEISVSPPSEGSQFRFTGDIVVQIVNFRGDVTVTDVIETSPKNTPIQQAQTYRTEFDTTKFPNDVYTLRASVEAAESEIPIETTIQFRNRNSSDQPPASNIRLPVRLGDTYNYPDCAINQTECVGLPIINRDSAILIEISDDAADQVDFLELRIICDPRIDIGEQNCATDSVDALLYNLDVSGEDSLIKYIFISKPELDGSQFIPDGNYILVLTTSDTAEENARRNIQELAIRVDRGQDTIFGLVGANVNPVPNDVALELNPESARWFITGEDGEPGAAQNSTRHIRIPQASGTGIYQDVRFSPFVTSSVVAPQYALTFANPGIYGVTFLAQDLVTGVVRQYDPPNVTVVRNPAGEEEESNSAPESSGTDIQVGAGTTRPIDADEIASDNDVNDVLEIVSIVSEPLLGNISLVDGSLSYTAPDNTSASDFFNVRVSDGTATVTVRVDITIVDPNNAQ